MEIEPKLVVVQISKKYIFDLLQLEYLGHAVSKNGLKLTLKNEKQFKSGHSLPTLESFSYFLAWYTYTPDL